MFSRSDSQAVLKALEAYRTKPFLVQECGDVLQKFAVANVWLPGNWGVPCNETSYISVKKEGNKVFTGPQPVVDISREGILKTQKKWAWDVENKYGRVTIDRLNII